MNMISHLVGLLAMYPVIALVCNDPLRMKYLTAYTVEPTVQTMTREFEIERALASIRSDFNGESESSGTVVKRVLSHKELFGFAVENPSANQIRDHPECFAVPFAAENFVIPYNLPKAPNVTLSVPILSAIFRGEIKHWNDSRIKSMRGNGDVSIRGPIQTCVRSDDSGETFVMTKAFRTADKDWTYGSFSEPNFTNSECCDSQNWPPNAITYFGKGMTGVVGIAASIPGVISYTTLGVAERFDLPYVRLINTRNKITPPTLESLSRTMEYAYSRLGNSFVFDLMDSPFVDAYPLASFEYIILPTMHFEKVDCCKVREIVGLIVHALTMKDSFYATYNKAKLPKRMIDDLINFKISRITCDGENMYDAYMESSKASVTNRLYIIVGSMTTAIVMTFVVAIAMITCNSYRKVNEEMRSWIIPATHLSINATSSDTSISRAFSSRCRSGIYQHNKILLREMDVMHPSKWSRKTKKQVTKWMKRISKPNVMVPHGFTQIERCVYSIWEFPGKGTLHHTIISTKFELDFDIKVSIAMDVADGLQYLHQHGIVVGNLTCQTCYMDGGWTAKIGCWMDTSIYLVECPDVFESYFNPDEQFMSLEDFKRVIFADPRSFTAVCDKKSDIFSLGMLLHEIFTAENNKNDANVSSEMVRLVQTKINKQTAQFPASHKTIPHETDTLIQLCTGDVEYRPSPGFIYKELRSMRTRKKGIVDMLMENMENYMNQLEDKIQQRTADLAQQTTELQKVTATMEGILFEVLPESVARQLIQGTRVEPEYFESVTIFFSDVVGFTSISAQLLPAEVMEFLNDLWLLFDKVAAAFDVYKVDTIGEKYCHRLDIHSGDCYMVGSGLPKRNGTTHVKEVCGMSIHLIEICPTLKVKKIDESIKVRVGINSGPVIAGIVGTRMPQYCVFGDTVNTASRMESTSEPMRIQITAATATLLKDEYPEFQIDYRGLVELKGKGMQETYWLTAPGIPGRQSTATPCSVKSPTPSLTMPPSPTTLSVPKPNGVKKGMFTAEKLKKQVV